MDIQKMKTLVVLSETLSYQETADRLFITQSNVSKQIQSIERELNVLLIDRSRRKIAMTECGELVVRHIRRLLDGYTTMLREINGQYPVIRLASIPEMAQYNITGLIAAFQEQHPDIQLSVDELENGDILSGIKNNSYDYGLIRDLPVGQDAHIEGIPICTDRLAVVLADDHVLAGEKAVSISRLKDEKFLLLDNNADLYNAALEACDRAGFFPHVSYTGKRMENIVDMVSKGAGISLLMQHAAAYYVRNRVAVVPLAECIKSEILLVRNTQERFSPPAKAFWAFVAAYDKRSLIQGAALAGTSF